MSLCEESQGSWGRHADSVHKCCCRHIWVSDLHRSRQWHSGGCPSVSSLPLWQGNLPQWPRHYAGYENLLKYSYICIYVTSDSFGLQLWIVFWFFVFQSLMMTRMSLESCIRQEGRGPYLNVSGMDDLYLTPQFQSNNFCFYISFTAQDWGSLVSLL